MEKFVSPCELPDLFQTEIGVIFMEECAEVQSAMSKCLRFGFLEHGPGQEFNNQDRLACEIGNLLAVLVLFNRRVTQLSDAHIKIGFEEKMRKHDKYAQRGTAK